MQRRQRRCCTKCCAHGDARCWFYSDLIPPPHAGEDVAHDHQRSTFDPISAPAAALIAIPTTYHVVTNATESTGQYIAYAIAPMPPESAPIAAPESVSRV